MTAPVNGIVPDLERRLALAEREVARLRRIVWAVRNTNVWKSLVLITPERAEAYLREHGWELREQEEPPNGAVRWYQITSSRNRCDALVPCRCEYADYGRRIGDLLLSVAAVENRRAYEVLADLLPEGDGPWSEP